MKKLYLNKFYHIEFHANVHFFINPLSIIEQRFFDMYCNFCVIGSSNHLVMSQ
jgi:hypothetical protein